MANIVLSGIKIDTEDIDLLVEYCPLSTLDAAVQFDKELLGAMPEEQPERPYWEHRLETHQIALDIAERVFQEGVKVTRSILDIKTLSLTDAIITEAKKPPKRTLKVIDGT